MPQQPPRLYAAGSSSAISRPGRANSCYLLQTGSASIVFDMGSGAFSQLRRALDFHALDAVVISHMHADHFIDLIQLRYALRYEIVRSSRLPVYLPAGGKRALTHIVQPLKETPDFFGGCFELHEYAAGEALHIGDASLTFAPTVHYVPAYAIRVESPAGTFAYSADTAPCDAVAVHAREADIFLCEAALGASGAEAGPDRGHSSALDAGKMAAQAGAKHLVITHYSSTADPAEMTAAARESFHGPITVADDGLEVPLVQTLRNEHV